MKPAPSATGEPAPAPPPAPPPVPIPNPKTQADDVLATVTGMLTGALLSLRIRPGNPDTVVHCGYPCTVITTERTQ
ncbi:MAG TPA: hypothetical protein VD994_07890 [Prosthecobacter sp.]|nr:hypothetical protein [Prosthecobacter sp.]